GSRQVVECLDEGPVRRAHHGVTRAVEHKGTVACRLNRELAHKAALPRPWLAAQQDDAAALALGGGHQRAERLQFSRAAGERESRCEAKRTGEIWHGVPTGR